MKVCGVMLLAAAVALPGCASDEGMVELVCYPGDKDCNEGVGGKAEAWNSTNDPRRVANNLEYKLENLPLSGEAENKPWSASYWPTVQGSTNYRWQGEDMLSPLEKFDMAFHGWEPTEDYLTSVPDDCGPNAHEEYTAYVDWLGPAASWQSTAQSRHLLFNGVNDDSDEDEDIDECTEVLESWWGLCHAWAPAAILEPEPLKPVEHNGQTFEVSDIKALIMTAYDDTNSLMLGGRCNAKEIEHDDTGRATARECRDTNAGAWHVVVTNFLGINRQGFVEDRTGGFEVWNQPLYSYEITSMEEITAAEANDLLNVEGDEYTYNDDAVKFYEVHMTTEYLTEGHQSTLPLGTDGYLLNDYYHYILEIDENGKIAGGEWVDYSIDDHPDFLWVPVAANTSSWRSSNPNVELDDVHMLLAKSREGAEEPEEPIDGASYSNTTDVSIPDDDPEGASMIISVPDSFTIEGMSASVEIEHTYISDLTITLEKDGVIATLHEQEGGDSDDISETYRLSAFDGMDAAGEWTLHVVDSYGQDIGFINEVTLTFAQ